MVAVEGVEQTGSSVHQIMPSSGSCRDCKQYLGDVLGTQPSLRICNQFSCGTHNVGTDWVAGKQTGTSGMTLGWSHMFWSKRDDMQARLKTRLSCPTL